MHEPRLKQRVQACSSSSGFGCIGLSDLGRADRRLPLRGEEGREKVPRPRCLKFAYVTATNAIASKRILKMRCPCSPALESWGRLESEASRCNCGSGERNHVGSVTTAMQPIAKLAGGGQKDCPRSPSLALALDGFTNWIVKARKKRTLDGGSGQASERARTKERRRA